MGAYRCNVVVVQKWVSIFMDAHFVWEPIIPILRYSTVPVFSKISLEESDAPCSIVTFRLHLAVLIILFFYICTQH